GASVGAALLEERFAAVEPQHESIRADLARQLDRRVAPAAADVERPRAGRELQGAKRHLAVVAQAIHENVAEALELRRQDVVPEGGEFVVRDDWFGHEESSRENLNPKASAPWSRTARPADVPALCRKLGPRAAPSGSGRARAARVPAPRARARSLPS